MCKLLIVWNHAVVLVEYEFWNNIESISEPQYSDGMLFLSWTWNLNNYRLTKVLEMWKAFEACKA